MPFLPLATGPVHKEGSERAVRSKFLAALFVSAPEPDTGRCTFTRSAPQAAARVEP